MILKKGKTKAMKQRCPVQCSNSVQFPVMRLFRLSLLLVIISLFCGALIHKERNFYPTKLPGPLLMQSGLGTGQNAKVSVVMFLDRKINPAALTGILPTGWSWHQVRQAKADGAEARTISAQRTITQEQEAQVFQTYLVLAEKMQAAGGHAYFEERIAESIDPVRYLARIGADPAEFAASGRLLSIAAWQKDAGTGVIAGADHINIQVAVRSGRDGGETVLAMPALLQEF